MALDDLSVPPPPPPLLIAKQQLQRQLQQARRTVGCGTGMTAVAGCRTDQAMSLQVN